MQLVVAKALMEKGARLQELGRRAEAIAACTEVVRRFGETDDPALLNQADMADSEVAILEHGD